MGWQWGDNRPTGTVPPKITQLTWLAMSLRMLSGKSAKRAPSPSGYGGSDAGGAEIPPCGEWSVHVPGAHKAFLRPGLGDDWGEVKVMKKGGVEEATFPFCITAENRSAEMACSKRAKEGKPHKFPGGIEPVFGISMPAVQSGAMSRAAPALPTTNNNNNK